jgi:hypothetical protein
LLRAIDRALAVMAEERPQTVEEWRAMLAGKADAVFVRAPSEAPRAEGRPANSAPPPPPPKRWLRALGYAAGVIAIAAAAIGLYELFRSWRG